MAFLGSEWSGAGFVRIQRHYIPAIVHKAAQTLGACLARLAAAMGQDLQGLHQGAAALRRGGAPLVGPILKRLLNVETAYQVTRHLREVRARALVQELDEALGAHKAATGGVSQAAVADDDELFEKDPMELRINH